MALNCTDSALIPCCLFADDGTYTLTLPERSVIFFEAKLLPSELETDKYFQPVASNFPAVDAHDGWDAPVYCFYNSRSEGSANTERSGQVVSGRKSPTAVCCSR